MGQDDRSLGDLTRQMSGWRSADPTELHLNDALVNAFLAEIDSTQRQLESQLNGASGLHDWLASANVGSFVSATTTRDHLQEDVLEFLSAIKQFNGYLNAVHATTDAARRNIHIMDSPR